jgi:hypothetical protein
MLGGASELGVEVELNHHHRSHRVRVALRKELYLRLLPQKGRETAG